MANASDSNRERLQNSESLATQYYGTTAHMLTAALKKLGVDTSLLRYNDSAFKSGEYKADPNHRWIDVPIDPKAVDAAGIPKIAGPNSTTGIGYEIDPAKSMAPQDGVTLKVPTKVYQGMIDGLLANLGGQCKDALQYAFNRHTVLSSDQQADIVGKACPGAPGGVKSQSLLQ